MFKIIEDFTRKKFVNVNTHKLRKIKQNKPPHTSNGVLMMEKYFKQM